MATHDCRYSLTVLAPQAAGPNPRGVGPAPARHRTPLCLGLAIAFAIVLTLAVPAGAQDKQWIGPYDGWWNNAANWSPAGVPGTGDFVQVTTTPSVDVVNYANPAGASVVLGDLTIDHAEFHQSQDTLATEWETVGLQPASPGPAIFVHGGGTNAVTNTLVLGHQSGSVGVYFLGGPSPDNAALSARDEAVGYGGEGDLLQGGGTNTVSDGLWLGVEAGSQGVYILAGGTLNVGRIVNGAGTGSLFIGGGTLNVLGGGVDVDTLVVGGVSGGNGSHTLSGTQTITAGTESIGRGNTTGTFTQTGGTNTVTSRLDLAYSNPWGPSTGSGTYHLQGGTLTAPTVQVNSGGTFDFTGGTLSVDTFNGDLVNAGGTLRVGLTGTTTTINGDYTETDPNAALWFEIGGLVTSEYDVLDVQGALTFGRGAILYYYSFTNGFVPSPGDYFDIIIADQINGSVGEAYDPIYDIRVSPEIIPVAGGRQALRMWILAVPEPLSMALVGTGLLGLMVLRRRQV